MSRPRQSDAIFNLMLEGWVSPLSALMHTGSMRLGARIYDMRRAGIDVEERWVEGQDGKRWKEFRLSAAFAARWTGTAT